MTGGLRLMRTEIFNAANGDRSGVPNVAILITDGVPTREVEQLPHEALRNKDLGTRIVGVAITNAVSECTRLSFLSSFYSVSLVELAVSLQKTQWTYLVQIGQSPLLCSLSRSSC